MFPSNISPKQMKKLMKRMGIQMEEINATEVIIQTPEKIITIQEPEVIKTHVGGVTTFQVSGNIIEKDVEGRVEIEKEDIELVAEQAGVSFDEAKKALESADGDIAQAILNLKT